MTQPMLEEQIAAAEAYEALHVPALFRRWTAATPAATEAASSVAAGDRVLDVACGTGVLARDALHRVGEKGSVAGVDPAAGMLAVAERLAPEVVWRAGTAEALPFPDRSFDAVVSQFGMMFFGDRVGALREMLRVLVPGGRLAVAVWGPLDDAPAYRIAVELLERLAGPRAADALRAPFVLGDRGDLARYCEEAGGASPEVTKRTGTARFPSVRALVEADLRGWLPVMGVQLEEERIQEILQAAESELDRFVAADGTMVFDLPAHILSAARP